MSNESNTLASLKAQLASIEQARLRVMKDLETKVSSLPSYLGLGSLEEVLDLIRAKTDTGSVEAFAGAALPLRVDGPSGFVARRRGQRGKKVSEPVRAAIRESLLRNEQGIDIARKLSVSPSTVSGIRKALEEAGKLSSV
jgi:hypothetical protein